MSDINGLVSYIMPFFNAESTIDASIKSMREQTYEDLEIILINDGSEDDSYTIAMENAREDSRIKLVDQDNVGLTVSLNRALELSTGSLIARQDADDVSLKHRLATQIEYMGRKGYDACTTRCFKEGGENERNKKKYIPSGIKMLFGNTFVHGSLLCKKSTILRIGGYNEEFKFAQDYDLFRRMLLAGCRLGILDEVLYGRTIAPLSISVLRNKEQEEFARVTRAAWRHDCLRNPLLLMK